MTEQLGPPDEIFRFEDLGRIFWTMRWYELDESFMFTWIEGDVNPCRMSQFILPPVLEEYD